MTKSEEVTLAEFGKDIEYIKKTVEEIKRKQEQDYVSREEFEPIKRIVYGMVAIVLTSVFGGLVALVVNS